MIFLILSCNSTEGIETISTKELKDLIAKESIQLIDVRTPKETKQGAIESAVFANYFDNDFTEQASKQLNKKAPVYVICRSGNRSNKACKLLKEKGFDVINVSGGFNQWKKEN